MLKQLLLLFVPGLLLVLGVDALVYHLSMDKERTLLAEGERRNVEKAERALANELANVLKDLTYLTFIHESADILQGRMNQDIEDTFVTLSGNRRIYDQIRYLSVRGDEVFRVNYRNGSPRMVRRSELQYKGDRYYFRNAIGLDIDEVYVSPMDLNVEHGEIEDPRKPVVRVGSAVVNSDGTTIGLLLINVLCQGMLDSFARVELGEPGALMLLNDEGYWLKGPEAAQEWGFMFDGGKRASFAREYPRPWVIVRSGTQGQFDTDHGVFTYRTLDIAELAKEATGLRGDHRAPKLKVVSLVPASVLGGESSRILKRISIYSGPVLLVLLLGAYTLSGQRCRRLEAEELVMRQIESNSRFVPREVLGLLNKGELSDVDISDHVQREMTTLFTDIRSYTSISEAMSPQQVIRFLNAYYQVLDPIITRNGGFIDAYIGDAVMALFPVGADGAVRAAVEIRKALADFRYESGAGKVTGLNTGVGLHCGEVTLGTVGTEHRMQTTAIGDSVNIASRIESATKVFGVNVIISGDLFEKLENVSALHVRSIDLVRVKGKHNIVELYEVFDADPPEVVRGKLESFSLFDEAMLHYREGDFQQAVEKLQRCAEICPEDTLPAIYIRRCNTMLRMPPGEGWSGVSTL